MPIWVYMVFMLKSMAAFVLSSFLHQIHASIERNRDICDSNDTECNDGQHRTLEFYSYNKLNRASNEKSSSRQFVLNPALKTWGKRPEPTVMPASISRGCSVPGDVA